MHMRIYAVRLMQNLWEHPAGDIIAWHPKDGRSERMEVSNPYLPGWSQI